MATQGNMVHEIAKLILEHAHEPEERRDAIERALYLGMALNEIEEYLDWLDAIGHRQPRPDDEASN